jgi:hypothetical protein
MKILLVHGFELVSAAGAWGEVNEVGDGEIVLTDSTMGEGIRYTSSP